MNDLHKLAARQLRKATRPDGGVDADMLIKLVSDAYCDIDADRRRSDRAMNIMVDELRGFNEQLENVVERRTDELKAVQRQLRDAVDNMHHGMLMIDKDRRLVVCNRRAREMLDIPSHVLERPEAFRETFSDRLDAGQLHGADPAFVRWMQGGPMADVPLAYQRTRENGESLMIHHTPLPDGSAVRTFIDITKRVQHESALKLAEEEYRGLFENAVFGIYRVAVDGRLLRANPALFRLHGFESEREMRERVTNLFDESFVEPKLCAEFRQLLQRDGRVTDFVTQARRIGGGGHLWISQNAWAIRDAAGDILFYEGTVLDSSERKEAEARIAHLAQHDPLTGLANRGLFHQQIDAAVKRAEAGKSTAIYCLDLDRFKEVNDALGHGTGDLLLLAVARRLRGCVRKSDTVARLGGDEFAIIQPGMKSDRQIAATASRIVEALSKPFRLGRHRVTVGVSIGVVVTPRDGVEPAELIRNADLALYRSKADGGQRHRQFDHAMFGEMTRRRTLEANLREAIRFDEMHIAYQPIVDLATLETLGYEALLRWTHPKLGPIGPTEFIRIAEETGLIISIGEWVLRETCMWIARMPESANVSVNVSAIQFRGGGLAGRVLSAIAAAGISPSRLTLEITETTLLADDPAAILTLRELRRLGVRIALDDFGTGFSSLTYLQRFPFDSIKIDRSFTARIDSDPVNAAAVRAIIALARDLGIAVVAEGVETIEEARALQDLGCRSAQGFLFSQPRRGECFAPADVSPAAEVTDLPKQSRSARRRRTAKKLRACA